MKFQSHHWPMWGNAKIIDYLKKQRDMYKYIHDQSVNLMNKGYTGIEISNMVNLPPELDTPGYNRGSRRRLPLENFPRVHARHASSRMGGCWGLSMLSCSTRDTDHTIQHHRVDVMRKVITVQR